MTVAAAPMPPVRPARPEDIPPLLAVLNAIIARGGTTAIETALSEADLSAWCFGTPRAVCCFVALDPAGEPMAFQVLDRDPALPPGWADIGTFSRREPRIRGAGTALFGETLIAARAAGLHAITATIRTDNGGGLAFYDRLGFETYAVRPAVPLKNGTPVDRVLKRFLVR